MNPQATSSDAPWGLPETGSFNSHSAQISHRRARVTYFTVIFGLDGQNNPDLRAYVFVREQNLAALPVLRHVDWRRAPLPLNSVTQRCAAQGQRVGMFLTIDSCEACMRGEGPFTSCVVAAVNGSPEFSGSCMNCAWRDMAHTCSFRMSMSSR
ncbi:hypothetical protein N7540_006325 [Penicillium herquei]|nr:hypothetical protein N7540_006325 [Penicillium herquei]